MFSYFVFNGVNSRDMGIYLQGPAPIMRGKERVIQQTVLGRAGALTLPEGDDVYEPYTQQLVLRAHEPVNSISAWLRGDGKVTFSGEPELVQEARVINQTQFKRISPHLKWWEGTVQFLCQPLKALRHEPEYMIASGDTLTNLGDVAERPILTFAGAYGTFLVTVGTQTLAITNLPAEKGGVVVDCGANMVLSYDKTVLLTNLSERDFPVLPRGRSSLSFTAGANSSCGTVTIGRRQRWL